MNLAKIIAIAFSMACASSPTRGARAIAQDQSFALITPSAQAPDSTGTTQQQPPAQIPPAASAPAAKTQPPNSKPRRHKRKKIADASKCESNPAVQKTANACPPSKTVVQNGGTSEPAVQITGGEGASQAQQKSTTDQLLGSTEDNLKKIAGRQLTPAQQDMVSQVRQYVAQSKEAVTAGDAERGRMLAQKAQLLSDELAKPQE